MRKYHLSEAVDLPAVFEVTAVDHLVSDEERLLVIFRNSVLDIQVFTGTVKAAELIGIDTLAPPPRRNDLGDITLHESCLKQIGKITDVDWTDNANTEGS